jgi:hypothetical protein
LIFYALKEKAATDNHPVFFIISSKEAYIQGKQIKEAYKIKQPSRILEDCSLYTH